MRRSVFVRASAFLVWIGLTPLIPAQAADDAGGVDRGEAVALLSTNSALYQEALAGVRAGLRSTTVRAEYLNAALARNANPEEYFRGLREEGVRLVVAVGLPAARLAVDHGGALPVIFALVDTPRELASGDRPLCGVASAVPVALFLRTLHELQPEARHVTAFYSTEQGGHLAAAGEYIDLQHGLLYQSKKLSDVERFESELQALRGRSDAILVVADPLYNRERFQQLSRFASENKIVLMSPFDTLVRLGATFGYSADYNRLGLSAGEMGDRILGGRSDCQKEGVVFPEENSFIFHLNEEYARQSGLTLPDVILRRAAQVRLTRAGVKLFNEGKYNSARSVFEAILRKDPENPVARYYRDAVVGLLTRDRIGDLLRRAREHTAARRFGAARDTYRQILAINPGVVEARDGFERSRQQESEAHRSQAEAFQRAGRPYDAIRSLNLALSARPENEAARNDLASLRAALAGRVAQQMQDGIAAYNTRDYRQAIALFESVLLVVPGHRDASEYLRLSRLKYDALQRLRAAQ